MTNPEPRPAPRASAGNPIARAHAEWKEGHIFEAGVGERTIVIDGDSKKAPSPVETLLCAVGTCGAVDVVDILAKQRTPVKRLAVDVMAVRRAEFPRRVESLEVTFTVEAKGADRAAAQRAVDLAIQKYCTVAASLAGDIEMASILILNGERGEPVPQPMFSKSFRSSV